MVNIQAAIRQATRLLEEGAISAPRLTAEVLLCHALKREKSYLYAHSDQELSELAWLHFGRYLHERLQGKPTQYITHRQEFYGREFRVSPHVLIPRPETEHVVERALELKPRTLVDVGCGSGAIGITLNLECGATVRATDISEAAIGVASENAASLHARVEFIVCDLLSSIAARSVDMMVSNPPYVPHTDAPELQREVVDFEPHVALFGGDSGFEIYERLVLDAARVLQPGGWLVMELGYRSAARVSEMLAGWRDVQVGTDLAGLPRVISARWQP
jgi:release factor glutamine methyltransferase